MGTLSLDQHLSAAVARMRKHRQSEDDPTVFSPYKQLNPNDAHRLMSIDVSLIIREFCNNSKDSDFDQLDDAFFDSVLNRTTFSQMVRWLLYTHPTLSFIVERTEGHYVLWLFAGMGPGIPLLDLRNKRQARALFTAFGIEGKQHAPAWTPEFAYLPEGSARICPEP